jgi:hypothetical protein
MRKLFALAVALLVSMAAMAADDVKITISNNLDFARAEEMVELDEATLKGMTGNPAALIVTDADGNEIPSQVTYDGKLIFQPGIPAKGKAVYFVKAGTPAKYDPRVFGRQFPERVDDIAWENDRVAFRCYGPALQRNGERAWGYDIWNKRTSNLVVEQRYAGELDPEIASVCKKLRDRGENDLADDLYNAVSYHVDHGNGMDCYKVGPTLGAGTTALLENGGKDIHYPKCYVDYKILDNGPLRFTVSLTYGKETVDGQTVVESRVVSIDAGSQLCKCVLSYDGLTKVQPLATGIIVHNENPSAYVLNPKAGYMGYEDLGDPNQYKPKYREKQNQDFGKIYVGTVFTQKMASMEFRGAEGLPGACGHILAISDYKNNEPYTYYFGTGWSRNPNTHFQSMADWEAYLAKFSKQVGNPLKIKFLT